LEIIISTNQAGGTSRVSRVTKARRIAAAAAYGGGGLGLAGAAVYGLLLGQAKLARRAIPPAARTPPDCDGVYRAELTGEPLILAMLGDSSAAGYGVSHARETPGALLAAGLAEIIGRPVRLTCSAVVGSLSSGLHAQLRRQLPERPDAAVIMIGGNDVTHRIRPAEAVRHLEEVVRELRLTGCEVVVGTCPDLGTIEPIQPPLRWVARQWSRNLAAAQTIAIVEAGGRSVSLGDLLGPEFAAAPREMFSADRFHPSAEGYSAAAAAVLPSLAAALGYGEPGQEFPSRARGEGVLPLAQAAVEAACAPGTEVSATSLDGVRRSRLGRWAQLRHRIRRFTVFPSEPVHKTDLRRTTGVKRDSTESSQQTESAGQDAGQGVASTEAR
jgi:lysophospholipase L1-like esterase